MSLAILDFTVGIGWEYLQGRNAIAAASSAFDGG
jgi:hypothetical protein